MKSIKKINHTSPLFFLFIDGLTTTDAPNNSTEDERAAPVPTRCGNKKNIFEFSELIHENKRQT